MRKELFLILAVSFGNFWIYQVFSANLLLGILILLESVLLFLSVLPESSKKIQVILFIILAGLSVFLLATSFNKEIFKFSDYEKITLKNRGEYFGTELGKIYGNRAGIFYFNTVSPLTTKISNNFASNLDLGKYFLSKKDEEKKYPGVYLPLFLLGLFSLIIRYQKTPTIYFLSAIAISGLIGINSKVGPVLLFPFFNLSVALGALSLWEKLRKI